MLSDLVSQGLGRPVVGLLSDRFGHIRVAGIVTLIASLATLLLWPLAGRYYAAIIVFALMGMFTGNLFGMIGPVTVDVVGIQLLPTGIIIAGSLVLYTH